jgi:chromosome segregation ATPase
MVGTGEKISNSYKKNEFTKSPQYYYSCSTDDKDNYISEINRLNQKILLSNEEIKKLKEEVGITENKIKILEVDNKELENSLKDEKRRIRAFKDENIQIMERLNYAENNITSLISDNEALKEENKELKERLNKANYKIECLEADYKNLRKGSNVVFMKLKYLMKN